MRLYTLGKLRLEGSNFSQPKPLVLLSYLSLEGAQSKGHLAELFWPEGKRLKSLSMTLTRLRQGVGTVIESDTAKAWINIKSDVQELLDALDKSDWQTAAEKYSGAFLDGVALDDWGAELENWVYSTREYLAERVQYALLNLAEEAARVQDFSKTQALAEGAYRLPGLGGNDISTLKRLYPLLCAGNSLLAPVVRKEAEAFDLKFRLSSTEARQRFRPEKPQVPQILLRNTSFVGRTKELAKLRALMQKPGKLLLTLVGTGGVGKTRLSLQLAYTEQQAEQFKDGVFFIFLEALAEASLLPSRLLDGLNLNATKAEDPFEQLASFLAERDCLIILDNFEHLTETAVLLSDLLTRASQLKLLVTSRERLSLEEEHVFKLEGLDYASQVSEKTLSSDAVQLFKERAQQLNPHFSLIDNLADVIRICQLVDGMPLAIELAASWIRLMSCQEIATEIEQSLELLSSANRNIPDRHRSLRNIFEQSWQLLTQKEQDVLAKLSVFRGGFRREAASEITSATIPILALLVDKSLLRVLPNDRYDLHPLLYQFTQEKLAEDCDNKANIQALHSHYYLLLSQQAELNLQGANQLYWFKRLDEEIDNIRITLTYFEQQGLDEEYLDLAGCLGKFWIIRGYYHEGKTHLTRASVLRPERKATAKVLLHTANISYLQGETENARMLYEKTLLIAQSFDDRPSAALALHGLGRSAFFNASNPTLARSYYEEGLAFARDSNDLLGISTILSSLGYLIREQGDYTNARTYFTESLELDKQHGNQLGLAENLNSLANLFVEQGKYEEAIPLYDQCLEIYRNFNERRGLIQTFANLGIINNRQGKYQKAYSLHQEALKIARDLGDKRAIGDMLNSLGADLISLEDYSGAKALLDECLEIVSNLGNKWQLGDALRNMGQICDLLRDNKQALDYYQQSLELARKIGDRWGLAYSAYELAYWYIDHEQCDQAPALLQEALQIAFDMQLRTLIVKCLESYAQLANINHHLARAAQIVGAAAKLRETVVVLYDPFRQRKVDALITSLKNTLGSQFAVNWRLGHNKEIWNTTHILSKI